MMTRSTAYVLGILATIILGTLLYLNLCSGCMTSGVNEVPTAKTTKSQPSKLEKQGTSYPFKLEAENLEYRVEENFNFKTASPSLLMPISVGVKEGTARLQEFLAENPNNLVEITGYYTADETNTTAFPNLGIARANSVKNHLVLNQISSSQINTLGELKNNMVPNGDVYQGPIAFSIVEKAENEKEELITLYKTITSDPLVLYFSTGEASINLNTSQRQKIAAISMYLDKVPDAQCKVVGHTDNTGNRETNLGLGLERAEFAKAYLVNNGISASKINTSSMGPDKPIAANDTEEGRAKNRRTVVTLN
mgnify:CR=1 FL=1